MTLFGGKIIPLLPIRYRDRKSCSAPNFVAITIMVGYMDTGELCFTIDAGGINYIFHTVTKSKGSIYAVIEILYYYFTGPVLGLRKVLFANTL